MADRSRGYSLLQIVNIELVFDAMQELDKRLHVVSRSHNVEVSWAPGGCTAIQDNFEGKGADDCAVGVGDNICEWPKVICDPVLTQYKCME